MAPEVLARFSRLEGIQNGVDLGTGWMELPRVNSVFLGRKIAPNFAEKGRIKSAPCQNPGYAARGLMQATEVTGQAELSCYMQSITVARATGPRPCVARRSVLVHTEKTARFFSPGPKFSTSGHPPKNPYLSHSRGAARDSRTPCGSTM